MKRNKILQELIIDELLKMFIESIIYKDYTIKRICYNEVKYPLKQKEKQNV